MKNIVSSIILFGSVLSSAASGATIIGKNWAPSVAGFQASDEEKALIDTNIANLGFFEDAEDDERIYYIPPFIPVDGIAGSAFLMTSQIEASDAVTKARANYIRVAGELLTDRLEELATAKQSYYTLLSRLSKLPPEQEFLRPQLTVIAEELIKEINELKAEIDDQDKLVAGALKGMTADEVGYQLASANINVSDLNLESSIDQGIGHGRLNKSYGGTLTVNVIAGLTPEQITALRSYKELRRNADGKYLSFAKLPVKTIEWQSLTEIANGENEGVQAFTKVAGGGSLEGATINLDVTVAAARGLKVAPPPFVLPVGASAEIYEKLPPFTAHLDCKIDNGWFYNGRTDIRDGLIVYNNDITQNIVSEVITQTDTPCKISYDGGGHPSQTVREAAIRKSMEAIMDRLVTMGLDRSNLAYAERKSFADGVQADIAANRHTGANSGWSSAIMSYAAGGWSGMALGLFSSASNFYWHTDIRNVEMTDTIDFEMVIEEKGNLYTKMGLPMQICLAWHPEHKAYFRCSVEQALTGGALSEAAGIARDSEYCEKGDSSEECGESRNEKADRNPETGTIELPSEV